MIGAIPGCVGGFAVTSLYNKGMVSFGALVAMMISIINVVVSRISIIFIIFAATKVMQIKDNTK